MKLTEEEVDALLAGLRKDLLKCKSLQVNTTHDVKHEYAGPSHPDFASHWGRQSALPLTRRPS